MIDHYHHLPIGHLVEKSAIFDAQSPMENGSGVRWFLPESLDIGIMKSICIAEDDTIYLVY